MKQWSTHEIQTACALYRAKVSPERIALELGTGRSRMAVIGQLDRQGVLKGEVGKGNGHKNKPKNFRYSTITGDFAPMASKNPRKPLPKAPAYETTNLGKPFLNRSATDCAWIYGYDNGRMPRCCGQSTITAKPYCPEHAAQAFTGKTQNIEARA